MFYELYDWDFDLESKEYHLINLNEVLQINSVIGFTEGRSSKTGQVYKAYKIKVYYTGHDNAWAFYYKSEQERNLVYEHLKQAMWDHKQLLKEPENPNDVSNILDGLKKQTNILEEMLKNPPEDLNIPEVMLCE